MDSLSVRLIKNSVVYPTIRVASHPGKLLMGVYDEDDNYVVGTALNRRSGEQGAPVPRDLFPVAADSDAPEAIYAGTLYFHFGHFLLESLARAWYAHQYPDVPFVWAGAHTWQGVELKPWQSEILDILMIKNPTRIIADPARFELLHIPDIGYRYDDRFHPEHAEFLGRYEGPAQVPGHRLWLSRSMIGSDVRDLNSAPAERRLAGAGWTIAHPETLSIREQLDHLGRAEIVAGEEGSAFHILILLKDVASKKFHILRRHGHEHGNMHTIGDARQVDQSFYSLERQLLLRAQGRVVSKISPNSSEILDILDVPVPTARDAAEASANDTVLERVLANFEPRRFLDVGASSPHLVVGSTAPTRVAVSSRFDFDPRTYAELGINFYELRLRQYAYLFHEDHGRFDVIRITGLEFEEVMASFRVSKRLAHERTTWILGSGDFAARTALAIRMTHPGFTARRLFVQRTSVYVAQRVLGEPADDAGVGTLSAAEVKRRIRWLPPATLRRMVRREAGTQG
ncbi:MAG: glycosyltransferase family 61 protein [Propionibacteriaceae bacterium]|nr:glycosyltransferase family 61 protein [Propionibacteriaceae bacterium]